MNQPPISTMQVSSDEKFYSWAERFIQMADVALRTLHLEYQTWNIGCAGIKDDKERLTYPAGQGVELVNETEVCSLVSRLSITSALFSGAIVDNDIVNDVKQGIRYWKIDRERKYPNSKECVDLFLQRYEWNTKEWAIDSKIYRPNYIEAKRAQIFTTYELEKPKIIERPIQKSAIKKDIQKLLKLDDSYIKTLLIWGVYDKKNNLTPNSLLNLIGDFCKGKEFEKTRLNLFKTRWIPIEWENITDPNKAPSEITRSLWVSLFELRPVDQ